MPCSLTFSRAMIAISLCIFPSFACAQVAPLSIAATGVVTSKVLDKAEQVGDNLIQQAGYVSSLTSSQTIRDLQLLISDARQQMHEELNTNWDRLDNQKVDLLRNIDSSIQQLSGVMNRGGLLEEDAYLDINHITDKLPFVSSDPIVGSVRGATVGFRETGFYRITVRGTVFQPPAGDPTVKIKGLVVGSPYVKLTKGTQHNEANIDFQSSYLSKYFADKTLSYLPITLDIPVPDKSYYFAETRKKYRTASYHVTLQLLPRHPIAKYSLIEMTEVPTVNKAAPPQSKWGDTVQVPGCGHDGCNDTFWACADVPAGAEPIAVVDHYDDVASYGEFTGLLKPTPGGICELYHQHRPMSRNIRIKVSYYPPDTALIPKDVELHPVSAEDSAQQPVAPAKELAFDQLYVAYFSNSMKSFRLAMTLFTGEPLGSTPEKTSAPILDVKRSDQTTAKEITIQVKSPL
jgi:hypothetical protein